MIKAPSLAMCVALLTLTAAIAVGACGDDTKKAADKAEAQEQAGTDGGGGSSNTPTGAPSTDTEEPSAPSGECERQVLDGKYISYVCPEGVEPPADDGTQLPDPATAEEPAPAPTEEPAPAPAPAPAPEG